MTNDASTQLTVRERVPPPHVAVQLLHAVADHVQAAVLHACDVDGAVCRHSDVSTVLPFTVHEFVRVCVPPLHGLLQLDQAEDAHVPQGI